MTIKKTVENIVKDGFILVFNNDKLDVVKTAKALARAGIGNMEVTCRISTPLRKIKRLRKEMADFTIGAASLIDFPGMFEKYNSSHSQDSLPDLEQVAEAGVDYLVSAGNFREESYQKYGGKIVMIPGCGNVSEVCDQFSMGANLCKVFPARQLGGPGFIKAIDPAIHKMISLVPTGGTNIDNIPEYIDAGVLAMGGSFSIIDKHKLGKIINDQDYKLLTEELKKVKRLIDEKRSKKWSDLNWKSASIDEISKATGRNFNLQ